MIETQPTVDTGCRVCGGVGWLREPAGFGAVAVRLRRCACNPEPAAPVAVSTTTAGPKQRRVRDPRWWGA